MKGKSNALRVFIDSNILVSAVLSESSMASKLLKLLIEEHHLIICSYSITEVSQVIHRSAFVIAFIMVMVMSIL